MEEAKVELIEKIEKTAEALYQLEWEQGIAKVNLLMGELIGYMKIYVAEEGLVKKINKILLESLKALEQKKYILLADILWYDLRGVLTVDKGESNGEK